MSVKNLNAERTTITRDTKVLDAHVGGNLFEAIVVLAKRSNQIGTAIKQELNEKLEEFTTSSDAIEEVFENREQIEISRHYERLPKPNAMAISELEDGKIYFRHPSVEELAEIKAAEEAARLERKNKKKFSRDFKGGDAVKDLDVVKADKAPEVKIEDQPAAEEPAVKTDDSEAKKASKEAAKS